MPDRRHPCLHPVALAALTRLHHAHPQVFATPTVETVAPDDADRVGRVAIASDFAIDTLARQPGLLHALLMDDGASCPSHPVLDADDASAWPARLRRHRAAASTRLVWRDVLGFDDIDATLAGSTQLAEACLHAALQALEPQFAARHGHVRAQDGTPVRLVVFGLGKLGGSELNFSSDIDIVYGYEHGGDSDGPRSLDAETYFGRLGQQLAKLLDEVTADGFCHRVDLRLRPYGTAGRVAWSFAAMEQYFQREGRDWERYAWQKARPVAGDQDAGLRFLETLRPFVYRRYLDFGALDGLRAMKASIDAEVARTDRTDDLKRGSGGIREVEFLAQALQLIHGGRDPVLRQRCLQPALRALRDARLVSDDACAMLLHAYRTLRHVENRVQMLADAQVHALPSDDALRERLAIALGHADATGLRHTLDALRSRVAAEFAALLAPSRNARTAPRDDAGAAFWRAAATDEALDGPAREAGFDAAAGPLLRDLARSPAARALSSPTRARLDRVMASMLRGAARARDPMAVLQRVLALLRNVLRRSAYLALLDEQPAALDRLVDALAHGALLAERLVAYPLLLDELLDARVDGPMPGPDALRAACMAIAPSDDTEGVLHALNEVRQALSFRIALATRDGRQDAVESARQLAWLADGVVARVLAQARVEVMSAHGDVPGVQFAVLGYGSLGGEELGFGSDLDLVFLFDAPDGADSDGARALDATRWCARLAQKVVALLGTATGAGRLFDVDVRLRPDGAKGLLVSRIASFEEYQRTRAWTWEHQALVRARGAAGDAVLCERFDVVRDLVLGRTRDAAMVRADVISMRLRMRAELDRTDAALFDLKQGGGGLVDLEFLLQGLVLTHAEREPALLGPRSTPGLIDALLDARVFDAATHHRLLAAHRDCVARGLACTLDRRPRRAAYDTTLEHARAGIRDACARHGFRFEPGAVQSS